ncbi:hypothetical protein MTR_4g022780 [Medicago truncatula]|uniref:Uncharacterized protein n=1 Tax=Medicago truncatula TaxID=3880 RepID=G7JVQ1_MEDTR|nr:hypothetical protein MTR_4g022780 [Medicago truncatula]
MLGKEQEKPTLLPTDETLLHQNHSDGLSCSSSKDEKYGLLERLFHFKKEKILQLKSKVNTEIGTVKIYFLYALLAHLWCHVTRSKQLDLYVVRLKLKLGSYWRRVGIAKGASEMNKLIASHTNEKLKNHYESWLRRNPGFVRVASMTNNNVLAIGTSNPTMNVLKQVWKLELGRLNT